jgi:hypothetical protein
MTVSSARDWKPQFAMSFTGLVNYLQRGMGDSGLTALNIQSSQQASILPNAREAHFRHALDGGFTHWLSLDDDMEFPADSFDRLIRHRKPVVAANYCRKIPGQASPVCSDVHHKLLDSAGRTGLEEIGRMGLGLSLVDMRAVAHVKAPRFEIRWNEADQMCCSDDVYFSDKLRAHGVRIYVDHDLSQDVRHIGDFPYHFPKREIAVAQAAE